MNEEDRNRGRRNSRPAYDDPDDDRDYYPRRRDNGAPSWLIPLMAVLGLLLLVLAIGGILWGAGVFDNGNNDNGTTNAKNLDSDGDGFTDAYETAHGTNPHDASSYPGSTTGNSGTATPSASSVPNAAASSPSATPAAATSSTGSMPAFVSNTTQGKWTIQGTDRLAQNPIVKDWLNRLCDPKPAEWKVYPNLDNPDAKTCPFEVANGVEYGVANVPFCQQDTRCDFVVPAWHYRLITADYGFQGMTCKGDGKKGCALLLINVMDQSYTWRNQMADNGFSVPGRFWNGDKLDQGVWGLVSNTSANMLGMPTLAHPGEVLNAGGDNAGSNCGTPTACGSVDFTVVVHAGDAIIAVAHTTVTP